MCAAIECLVVSSALLWRTRLQLVIPTDWWRLQSRCFALSPLLQSIEHTLAQVHGKSEKGRACTSLPCPSMFLGTCTLMNAFTVLWIPSATGPWVTKQESVKFSTSIIQPLQARTLWFDGK